jgi:hypothetical protein
LDATKKYPKIIAAKWKTFVEQKISEELLSKSQTNNELSKKNIYHHLLGTGGYKRAIPKWKVDEAARKASDMVIGDV